MSSITEEKMKRLAIYRIIRIVWLAIKFFTQLTIFQKRYKGKFTPSVQERWEKLVTKQAKEYKKTALSLGGILIKVGQFLSTRADILPPSFLSELEGLTDHVPPVPRDKAIATLEEEWNRPYNDILINLSEQPTASASIGEVYKGVLKDGKTVAIKIQRPNIEKIIRSDFQALKIVLSFAKKLTLFNKQIDFNLLYRELVDIISDELNFLQEMEYGKSFATRFSEMEGVQFPIYIEEFTTRRVLVMEWIEGKKVTDIDFLDKHHIDRKQLAERIFYIFLEQILRGGQFHADPHSGNILVKEDGTVVLIDFGMVGSISPAQTKSVAKLVEGIIFQNYNQMVDCLEELKFLLPNADRQLLIDAITRLIKAYEKNEFQTLDSFVVDQLLKDLMTIVRTQPIQMPAEFAFFGRAIQTFLGVVQILDPKIDIFALARVRVIEWAKGTNESSESSLTNDDVKKMLKKVVLPLVEVPAKLSVFLDEPTRMRQYIQQRDIEQKKEQARLQTRRFSGIIMIISISVLFYSVWSEHQPLLLASSSILLLSAIIYKRA